MSAADTKALIATAVGRLIDDVPALRQLKLVVRLQLEAKGGDAPIWRVEVPGPKKRTSMTLLPSAVNSRCGLKVRKRRE